MEIICTYSPKLALLGISYRPISTDWQTFCVKNKNYVDTLCVFSASIRIDRLCMVHVL